MNSAIQALFSWQFLLFSLSIALIVWVIRQITNYFFPKLDGNNQLWDKLILPLMPIFIGVIIGFFATKYSYPDGLTALSSRLMFGGVAGMFSGLVYQVANGMLKNAIQTYISGNVTTNITTTTAPVIVAAPTAIGTTVTTSTTTSPLPVTASTPTTATNQGMSSGSGPTPGQA